MENIRWTPLKRFFKLLAIDRKDISYIYLYAIFSGIITLTIPLGVQAIIGLIAGGTMSYALYVLVGIVTVGTALTGVLKVMQLTVTETIQRRIFARSSFEFAYRLPHMQLEGVENAYAPELVNRFFDTLTIQKGLPKIMMDFSTAILNIVFGLLLISFYHPFFAFFSIALVLLLSLIFWHTGKLGLDTSLKESKYKYAVAHWLEEIARANTTFKLSNGDSYAIEKTDGLVVNYLDARKKHFKILLWQYSGMVLFKVLVTATLLFLGSKLVIENQINIGQFVAAEIVVLLVLAAVEKLILSMETIYDTLTALEKLGQVMDLPLDKTGGVSFKEIDTGKGIAIKLNDVEFKFKDSDKPSLKGINLDIQPNERICIAGYNHAGRSTLAQLISGFYYTFQGSFTINGIPMKNLNIDDLHNRIGEFTSDLDIFEGSIKDNITVGQTSITLPQITSTAEKLGMNDFINQLPNGYGTMLLPGGKNIPSSLRNKIILARGIIAQPQLFILEDFLTKMERTEREQILNYLVNEKNNWTLVAISDSVGLAQKCDRIYIMSKGEIIESGNFEEIKKSPHFNEVFKAA